MTSAFLGMYLMPSHGWQSVFFVAGIPLLLLPLIWIFLPEAVGFLLKVAEEAGRLLARVEPSNSPVAGDNFHLVTGRAGASPWSRCSRTVAWTGAR